KRLPKMWKNTTLPYWRFIVDFPYAFNKFLIWLGDAHVYTAFLCPPHHVSRLLSNVAPPSVIVFYFKQANVIFTFNPSAWWIRNCATPFSLKKSKNIHISFY